MKKKNYVKLKISNNKIILKEEGTKYGNLGKEFGKKYLDMFGDSLKMVKTTVQRAWGSTFLYGYNIIVAVKEDGIKGLHNANRQFHRDDAALKREQMQLIASQPGNKDAKLFLGMTCPAALAFDKYVDTDLSIFRKASAKAVKDFVPDERDAYDADVAYTNIVSVISHLSDNTALNFVEVKFSKSKNKKVPILSAVKDNVKKDNFRGMCKYLQKYYKSNTEVEMEDSDENKRKNQEDTFFIGIELKNILEMLYNKKSRKAIINYIKDNGIATSVNSRIKKFVTDKARKQKIKNEFQDFIKDLKLENFQTKLSFKNKTIELIKEEEYLPPYYTDGEKVKKSDKAKSNKSATKEDEKKQSKKVDAKTGMMLSFAEYYLLGIDILMLNSEIVAQKNNLMIVVNEKLLESLSKKENFDSSVESMLAKKIQEVNNLVNTFNQKLPLLQKFKIKIEKIEKKDIEEFTKNFNKSLEMIKSSYDKIKDQSETVKDLTYSQVMLDIIKKIKPTINNINPNDLEGSFTESFETINSFYSEIEENYIKVCKKNNSLLLQNKINYQEITSKKQNFANEINQIIKNLKNSFKDIENFTNKESELESFTKEQQDEIENQEGEKDSSEDSKVSESDFVKSEIVKIMDS